MISSLYLIASNGDVIIEKHMREKLARSVLHEYYVSSTRGGVALPAASVFSRFAFFALAVNDIYLIGVAPSDVPPVGALELLQMIARILVAYLPDRQLTHTRLLESFSTVYQLLEEVIDYGYPLTTELHELQELVAPPTFENRLRSMMDAPLKVKSSASPARSANGIGSDSIQAVPWRDPNVQHQSNQMLFDVVEYMDVTMDTEGNVSRGLVRGQIEVKAQMSGMPDVSVAIANVETIDDIAFHRCVRYGRWEADRSISFVPPEGFFTLAEYRCKPIMKMQPHFYISPQISFHKDGGRISIMCGLRGGGKTLTAEERNIQRLSISIPLPPMASAVNVGNCTGGQAQFDGKKKCLVWRIGALDHNSLSLNAEVHFAKALEHDPGPYGEHVRVEFTIPNYALSGVRVAAVNVHNTSPSTSIQKLARNHTRAGNFFIRSQ